MDAVDVKALLQLIASGPASPTPVSVTNFPTNRPLDYLVVIMSFLTGVVAALTLYFTVKFGSSTLDVATRGLALSVQRAKQDEEAKRKVPEIEILFANGSFNMSLFLDDKPIRAIDGKEIYTAHVKYLIRNLRPLYGASNVFINLHYPQGFVSHESVGIGQPGWVDASVDGAKEGVYESETQAGLRQELFLTDVAKDDIAVCVDVLTTGSGQYDIRWSVKCEEREPTSGLLTLQAWVP